MYPICFAAGFAAGILFLSEAQGEPLHDNAEAVTIPLDEIWAYEMPGTRSVRRLEPQQNYVQLPTLDELIRDSLVARIQHVLLNRPNDGKSAGPAFVVSGHGKEALKNAADVITKKAEAPGILPPNVNLTLIFYSYSCGRYVWIDSVRRSTNQIVINYRFVSHRTNESTAHFALIPLGKLRKGIVQVEVKQLPPSSIDRFARVSPMPDPKRVVCDSFSFQVGE